MQKDHIRTYSGALWKQQNNTAYTKCHNAEVGHYTEEEEEEEGEKKAPNASTQKI